MAKQIITAEQLSNFYGDKLGSQVTQETITTPVETPKTGILSNLKSNISAGIDKIKSGFKATQEGAMNKDISTGATQQARGALGMASGAIQTAFSPVTTAFQSVSQIPGIKQVIGTTQKNIVDPLVDKVASLPSVQKFAMENPNSQDVISDLINVIGTVYSPQIGKGATRTAGAVSNVVKPVAGEVMQGTGKLLATGADDAVRLQNKTAVAKLLEPVDTKASRLEAVGRTKEKGILGTKVVEPTMRQAEMIDVISEVPTVNPKKTFQSNYNALKDFNTEQAIKLEADVKANNFIIPRKETISRLNTAIKTLEESPVIVGDAQKTAMRLVEGAKKFVNESDGTGAGILEARKKYDSWVLSQKPKAFDANTENAFTIANREVRNTLNTLLDEKATNVDVKGSLKKQSLVFDALDVLEQKASTEGRNKISRVLQRVGNIVGTKNQAFQTLASLGLVAGGGVALATALPLTLGTGAGYLLYRGGKYIVSPQVRKAIGQILETSGNKLNPADKKVLEQLSGKSRK